MNKYIYIYIYIIYDERINIDKREQTTRKEVRITLKRTRNEPKQNTANLLTNIVDFRGLDSSTILILRGGIPRPIGDFPESLSQSILVGTMLVGRSGVRSRRFRPRTSRLSSSTPRTTATSPPRSSRRRYYVYVYIYIYICVCVCMYTYIYIYIYIYTHTFVRTYVHTYIHTYIHT